MVAMKKSFMPGRNPITAAPNQSVRPIKKSR